MTNYIYRVFLNDVVVAVFNKKKFATDFIDYQATICRIRTKAHQINIPTETTNCRFRRKANQIKISP